MADDIECNKVFTVKLALKNYDETTQDAVQEKLYWHGKEAGEANIGWCAGVHIASAIRRLFPGYSDAEKKERKDCFAAILDSYADDQRESANDS